MVNLCRYLGMLWTIVKVRKETVCYRCDGLIFKGSSAFRPLTNNKLRMYRLCQECGNIRDFRPSTS